MNVILVAVGGFFGSISRYGVSQMVKKRYPTAFPLATFIVNLMGAFLLGWLIGSGTGRSWQLLLGTGFLGAFTTFSTFKLENIELHAEGNRKMMIIYLAVSYIGGILLAFAGLVIGTTTRP
ncbi:MAG TPA: fluoride efflux transporter CrcB [Bacillales bacterium]|nr:fluoride efflux transporter CrcB [Bacillales bacterium]